MPDEIRPAAVDDKGAIARIYVDASVAALGTDANLGPISEAAAGRHAMWSPLLRPGPGQAMSVFDDGAVRGFVSSGPAHDDAAGARGHVYALYVDPERWSTGIGRRLLHVAIADLKASGVRIAELWVQEENRRARRFYELQGWAGAGDERRNDRGTFLRYTTAI